MDFLMNKTSLDSFFLLQPILVEKTILKGSFVLYTSTLKYNKDKSRDVKDLDVTINIKNNNISNIIIDEIYDLLMEKYENVDISNNKKTKVWTIKAEFKNTRDSITLIDITEPKTIEYEKYMIGNKDFIGSSVYQMLADKLFICANVRYRRLIKDMKDLKFIIENYKLNLLDLWDCIFLNGYNKINFEIIYYNVKEASKSLRINTNKDMTSLNFIYEDLFEKFIKDLMEAHKFYKTLKLKYNYNEVIQREYIPLYMRDISSTLTEDTYNNFYFNKVKLEENKKVNDVSNGQEINEILTVDWE